MMTTTPTITLPKPELVIPGFADLPEAIQAAIEELSRKGIVLKEG